jgi:hypothetical protein
MIDKMKKTKHELFISKMKWDIVNDYLDIEIDNGSRNRDKIFITLRQFKEYILSGIDTNDIKKLGISKHLIQFFSNFSQGKIHLTKEDFIKKYESGLSLKEIALEYQLSRDDIVFLRQLYQIKAKGPTFQHRKKTEVPLTQRQKEILYGSLMGDAKKTSPASVGFGQSEKQKDYLLWKYEEMKSVASEKSLKLISYNDKRSKKKSLLYRFYTYANTDIENIIKQFYCDVKEVSKEILDNLSPLSIAVWFMDDGTTGWHYQSKESGINAKESPKFCTDSFSLESCELIVKFFLDKYNIKSRVKRRGTRKDGCPSYRIIIENKSVDDFFSLIRPNIIPSMLYKINYSEYLIWRKNKGML